MNLSSPTNENKKSGTNWFVKIVLLLIIISFGFWGVQGYFTRRGSSQTLAEVGEVSIYPEYFRHRLTEFTKNLRGDISWETLKETGILTQILRSIINQILIDLEMQDLRLTTGEKTIVRFLESDPAFRNDQGRFSPEKLANFLKNSGIPEKQLLQDIQKNILQQQLLLAVTGGTYVPAGLSLPFFETLTETRDVHLIDIPFDQMNVPNAPSDETLEDFYKANNTLFQVPEYRRFSVLVLDPTSLAKDLKHTEAELKETYEQHITHFTTPETRDVSVLTLQPEEVFDPKNPSSYKARFISLGELQKDGIDPTQSAAIFSLDVGAYSAPLETDNGRKVFHVQKIHPATVKPFSAVKQEVKALRDRDYADKEIINLTQQIDDQVAGGTPLVDIAQEFNIPLYTILPLSLQGTTRTGEKAQAHISPAMIKTAFQQEEREDGQFNTTPDGITYLLKVEEIVPQGLSPFTEVKTQVRQEWTKKQQQKIALEKANELAQRYTKGEKNISHPYKAMVLPKLTRESLLKKESLPIEEVNRVFELPRHSAYAISTEKGAKIAVIKDIDVPTIEKRTKEYVTFKEEVSHQYAQDIQDAFLKSLEQKFGVTIHEDALSAFTENL